MINVYQYRKSAKKTDRVKDTKSAEFFAKH